MRKNIEDKYLWVGKYRPKTLKELVIPEEYSKIFQGWIDERSVPHLLLHGPPGSGKTTLAQILVRKIPEDHIDVLSLNGSATTSVEVVRNLLDDFCSAPSISDKPKICFIDEFEFMSLQAQAALRNMMEEYEDNVRFILTCNRLHKVMDALQSRCQMFEFKKIPMDFIKTLVKKILESEKVEYDEESIFKIVSIYYPDVRKILNTLQSRVVGGKLSADLKNVNNQEKLIRSYVSDLIVASSTGDVSVINKTIQKVIKTLGELELDYSMLYEDIFFDKNVPMWAKPTINNYYNKQEDNCASPSMNFMACIFQIITTGTQLRKSKTKV